MIAGSTKLNQKDILNWLKEEDNHLLNQLWQWADEVRRNSVGNEVHLRGIIEFSNHCVRTCQYCGLNSKNKKISRYTMSINEIVDVAKTIETYGYGTVVLQSGEDFRIEKKWISNLIKRIKKETNLAITLSLGERTRDELTQWKNDGADRYLLKIETSNAQLFGKIHPTRLNNEWKSRTNLLKFLAETGYETGSGIMIGIPRQTYQDLVDDMLALQELNLDMMGIGPFIPHPETELYNEYFDCKDNPDQVPNSELMTYKVNAIMRIICPDVNIPTTTALATLNRESGRELGLIRGANVIMPNFTPLQYRKSYEIYPNRVCLDEYGDDLHQKIKARVHSVGRVVGSGQGVSKNYLKKNHQNCHSDPDVFYQNKILRRGTPQNDKTVLSS